MYFKIFVFLVLFRALSRARCHDLSLSCASSGIRVCVCVCVIVRECVGSFVCVYQYACARGHTLLSFVFVPPRRIAA